jgi:hypothetical protein
MRPRVEFEDIEGLRREAGIDDGELREQVRRLRAGDSVRLTAATGGDPGPLDRLLVRIISVRAGVFHGSIVRAAGTRAARLEAGSPLTFRAAHIHSVVGNGHGGTPTPAPGRTEPQPEGATLIANKNISRPPVNGRCQTPLLTTEMRLKEIEELLKRVNGYAEFMCRTGGLEGTSPEAREQAVAAFHERMAAMERHLSRVHDEFRLG